MNFFRITATAVIFSSATCWLALAGYSQDASIDPFMDVETFSPEMKDGGGPDAMDEVERKFSKGPAIEEIVNELEALEPAESAALADGAWEHLPPTTSGAASDELEKTSAVSPQEIQKNLSGTAPAPASAVDSALDNEEALFGRKDIENIEPVVPARAAITPMVKTELEPLPVAPAPLPTYVSRKKTAAPAVRPPVDRVQELQEKLARIERESRQEKVNSYFNMGCVYRDARQFQKAEAAFLKAHALNPDDPGVHYNLGVLYDDQLHNNVRAREHYARFLELAPNDPDAPQVRDWLASINRSRVRLINQ